MVEKVKAQKLKICRCSKKMKSNGKGGLGAVTIENKMNTLDEQ